MSTDNRTVCLLPAAPTAAAWLNVYQAAGQGEAAPVLYRTVCVEVIDASSARFISTDSHLLLTSAVREGGAPVADDEAAARTIVAIDEDERAKALFKFVAKDTKAKENIDATVVRLSVGSIESEDAPTLMPSLARLGLAIEYEAERLVLPIWDGEYPAWRHVITGREPSPVGRVAWSPWVMSRLSSMRSCVGGHTGAITLDHAGPLGAAAVTVDVFPEVSGVAMPMRIGTEAAA